LNKKKILVMVLGAFLVFQATLEKASALPPIPTPIPLPTTVPLPTVVPVPTAISGSNPLTQPQQNLNVDSRIGPSLSSQLLSLMSGGSVGIQGPASSELIFAITAPLTYNTNPGLASGSAAPAWDFDPQVEMLHSAPLAEDLLLTVIIGADTAIYPDNSGYNLNTLSAQFQVNFTDKGIQFESSPFVALKSSFTVPAGFSGYAWVSDVEAGYNFNRIFGTGGRAFKSLPADQLEIDFNPGLSQRWIQVNDGSGNYSWTGSSALEIEIPFIYRFTSRLNLIFDLTAFTRYYNVNQVPANGDRVDQVFSLPLSVGWTMVPVWNLKVQVLGGYTQQFSSAAGQNITQLDTGVNLQMAF